ncbi:HAD-IA family hydrolase [Candidatus Fermentibacteria bacterium]|nr:HAD-IA family hydrolase [Candidatus Fermentibacteria bacterium]
MPAVLSVAVQLGGGSARRRSVMNYLLDMDGVLVDSKKAWFKTFRELGGISREEFENRFWGRDLEANIEDLGTTSRKMCDSVLTRYIREIELMPKALDLLSALPGKKALVTNTTLRCTRDILRQHGLGGFFDVVVTSDQVESGKPNPAMIERAIAELAAEPDDTVLIGDSEEDIQAGRRAGCLTIGVGVPGDYRADSLEDVLRIARRLETERR